MTEEHRYRGDTVGKKIARYAAWRMIRKLCPTNAGALSFDDPRFRCVYLASEWGGDASVLRGFDKSPDAQLAVDCRRSAIAKFSQKFPTVPTFYGDVADACAQHRGATCVFLDFCGPITSAMLKTILRIVPNMKVPGILTVAFLRGREIDHAPIASQVNRPAVGGTNLMPGSDAQVRGVVDGRVDYLARELNFRLQVVRRMVMVRFVYTYQSRTDETNGVPMVICGLNTAQYQGRLQNHWLSYGGKGEALIHRKLMAKEGETKEFSLAKDFSDKCTKKDLREAVLHAAREYNLTSSQAADCFNISAGTVAAWKAHETMGAYNGNDNYDDGC